MDTLEKKIKTDIKIAVANLKGSYLNDESNTDASGFDALGSFGSAKDTLQGS